MRSFKLAPPADEGLGGEPPEVPSKKVYAMARLTEQAAFHSGGSSTLWVARAPARAAALAVAYFFGAEMGHALSLGSSPAFATFWPPSGILLAALLLSRRSDWPLLVLATLPANLLSNLLLHGKTLPVGLGFWLGNAAEAVAGASLFLRFAGGHGALATVRGVLVFVVLSAAFATMLSATAGTATLHWAYGLDAFAPVWLAWWSSDALGILVVTPVFIAFAPGTGEPLAAGSWRAIGEMAVIVAALLAVSSFVTNVPALPLPLLLWAALRLGRRGVSLAALVMTVTAVHQMVHRGGPPSLAQLPGLEQVFALQVVLAILLLSFLVVGAVLAERELAQHTSQRHATELRRFARAVESATDAIAILDVSERVTYVNPAFIKHFTYTGADLDALEDRLGLYADPAVAMRVREAAFSGKSWSGEIDIRARDGRIVPASFSINGITDEKGKLTGVLAVGASIEERRRLERRRAAAHEITQVMANAITLDEAAPRILSILCSVLDWSLSTLWLLDPQAGVLRAAHIHPAETGELSAFAEVTRRMTFSPDVGLPGRVLSSRRAIWIEEVSRDPSFLRATLAARHGLRTALALPIVVGEQVEGVIELLSRQPRTRDDALIEVVESIGLQAAQLAARARTVEALELAKEGALAASRTKSDFLANVTHEIRTPMNAIVGMLELLAQSRLDPEQHHYVEVARSSGRALLDLIKGVLDFSKIEAGKLDLEVARFDVRRLVADSVEGFETKARRKGLDLTSSVAASVPGVLVGDPVRLRQILNNLLDNAIKFTEKGGVSLAASAERAGGGTILRCDVTDTGIGIRKEDENSIFGAFEQTDPTITRRYGGTGLGLAICRRLIELMHGRIWVDSEAGRGSAFHFTALLRAAEEGSRDAAEAPPAVLLQPSRRLKILVFEDNPVNMDVVSRLLERDGHVVAARDDATDAPQAAASDHYDLILMDLQMPAVSGFEATAQIRAAERARRSARVPIVALTARALEGDRERCLEAGMDGYVSKPFFIEDLRREIEHVLRTPEMPRPAGAAPVPEVERVRLDGGQLMRRIGGEVAFLEHLVAMFSRDRAALAESISSAFESGDLAATERAAHRLKAAAGNLGGMRVFSIVERIEATAGAGTAEGLRELIAVLRVEVEELAEALVAFVEEKKRTPAECEASPGAG